MLGIGWPFDGGGRCGWFGANELPSHCEGIEREVRGRRVTRARMGGVASLESTERRTALAATTTKGQETMGSRNKSPGSTVRSGLSIMGRCHEGPRVLFPLPQASLVGDRTYTLPRFYCDATGSALGVWRRRLGTSGRQRKASFVAEGNGTFFPIPLALSQPNDLFRRGLEMCVAFSYQTH